LPISFDAVVERLGLCGTKASKGLTDHPAELTSTGLLWNAVTNRRVQRNSFPGANLSNRYLTRTFPGYHEDNPSRSGLRRVPLPGKVNNLALLPTDILETFLGTYNRAGKYF
jgi:hypothetical protein